MNSKHYEKNEKLFRKKRKAETDTTPNFISDCNWLFDEDTCLEESHERDDKSGCQLASPSYPGIYPPRRRCQYLIHKSKKESSIRLTFTKFNLPPE